MNKKIAAKIAVLVIGGILLYQIWCYAFWFITAWSDPNYVSELKDKMSKMPTYKVVKELHSIDIFSPYPQTAIQVLANRKAKDAVPELIELTTSWNKHIRRDAIWALGVIGDPRAINPLMAIAEDGEKNANYKNALSALSKMRYEKAFPYVVELSKQPDAYRNGSVNMLKDFGKPECIPILLDIKNRIKDSDPQPRLGKSLIDDAIKEIKAELKNQ